MTKSAAATSRFVRPSATSAAIRCSASVSSSRDGARPPIRASSARVWSAQSGAPTRSKRASASSSVRRASPRRFARRCVRPSASSVRACWNGSVVRACSASACSKLANALSRSPRAARRSARHRAVIASAHERSSAPGALLPRHELLLGLVELADRDQRLQSVSQVETMARLEHADAVADLPRPSEVRERRRCIAEGELDEAEHPAMARLPDADAVRLRERERPLGPIESLLDPAPVRGDERGRELGDRPLLAAELRADRGRFVCIAGGQLPVAGTPLQDAQQPERVRLIRVIPGVQGSRAGLREVHGRARARPTRRAGTRGRPLLRRARVLRQGPLQRKCLLHLRARDASPAAEMQEAEARQRLAPELVIPGT